MLLKANKICNSILENNKENKKPFLQLVQATNKRSKEF
jgi:hypothetical protein